MQFQGSYQFSNLNESSKVTRRHAIYNRQNSDILSFIKIINYHLKKTHPHIKIVVCNFKRVCKQIFPCVEVLVLHLKYNSRIVSAQTSTLTDVIEQPCKCDR